MVTVSCLLKLIGCDKMDGGTKPDGGTWLGREAGGGWKGVEGEGGGG